MNLMGSRLMVINGQTWPTLLKNDPLEELKAFTKKCARGSHFPVNDDGWFFAVESAKRG